MTAFKMPKSLYDDAKKYNVNISAAARAGIMREVERQKRVSELYPDPLMP